LARPAQQWNTRLDQYFREYKDRIFFNYYNYLSNAQSANPRPLQRITQPNHGMFGKVGWTRTIRPSLLNEASMTLVRADGATPPTDHPELPTVTITGMQGFSQSQIGWVHANYNWHDVVSITSPQVTRDRVSRLRAFWTLRKICRSLKPDPSWTLARARSPKTSTRAST
jgi:hypothetical protein